VQQGIQDVPPVEIEKNTSPGFPALPDQAGTGMQGIETAQADGAQPIEQQP
jgi:hypothetical protein